MAHSVDYQIGRKIRHSRWMQGMTQQQLGDQIGATIEEIKGYEAGTRRISDVTMLEIADAMGVSSSSFIEGMVGHGRNIVEANSVVVTHKEALEILRSYFSIPTQMRPRFFRLAGIPSEVA
jgi:transcriptional regulator with XRE-family HTH domain